MGAEVRIVGREHELAALRGVVDGMPAGAVVVVDGEPGVGKTTILDVACARASAAGAVVIRVSADEFSAARPLGILPGAAQGADSDAVLEHLERTAAGRPCMVAFDDLQWADPASLALLGPLVRRAVPAGVVLILAHRAWPRVPALDELLDRIAPMGPVSLSLQPMSAAEVRVLGELEVGKPLGAGVRGMLDSAGGNPFYALSIVRMLDAEGSLDDSGAVAELAGQVPGIDRSSLGALVVRRVALLGPPIERLLQHAAVLGRTFRLSVVADLVDRPIADVAAQIAEAVRAQVLSDDGDSLSFRHDLLRDALANSLPAAMRMVIHRRAAMLLLDTGDRAAAAAHLLRAELQPGDVTLLESLVVGCAPPVGLALLDRALSLVGDDDPRYVSLATERVDFLLWNGHPQEAVDAARALLAAGLGDSIGSPLRATVAHALFVLGRPGEAVDSWDRWPDSAPATARAIELAELAFASLFAGRLRDAHSLATQARGVADDDSSATVASLVLAYTAAASGDPEAARLHADAGVRRAVGADESARRFGPNLIRASVRDFLGDAAGALDDVMADEHEPVNRASVLRVPFRLSVAATVHFRAGRWDDALANADAGALAARDLQVSAMDAWLSAVPMLIALFRHGPKAAALVPVPNGQSQLGGDWLLMAQMLVREAEGDAAGALDVLELVAQVGDAMGSTAAVLLVLPDVARLAVALHQPERGAAVFSLCGATDSLDHVPAGAERAWAGALLAGDPVGVNAAAERLAPWRPFQAARAWRDAALMLAATEPIAARDAANRALGAFEQLGAEDAAARFRAHMREVGVRLRTGRTAPDRVGWASVTATERMVVELVAGGRSNAEIAATLYTSRRTVESHLVHVYNKVGVRSRVELAREAARRWNLGPG